VLSEKFVRIGLIARGISEAFKFGLTFDANVIFAAVWF